MKIMKQQSKKKSNFLRNFDIFGSPVELNLGGNDRITSTFGGILTLMLYLFLLSVLIKKMTLVSNPVNS